MLQNIDIDKNLGSVGVRPFQLSHCSVLIRISRSESLSQYVFTKTKRQRHLHLYNMVQLQRRIADPN